MRDTLAKVRKKDREALAQDLKGIWRADTVKQAHRALRALEEKWGGKYPELVAKWLDKRPSRSS
ncbi:transposase [Candidatus Bipolaricaulota bacterium]|nr:transposase [Candidatus Bipolaricaulota bacterium]